MKTVEEIVTDSKSLQEVPDDYDFLEMSLFFILKNLITLYNYKQMSADQVVRMKEKAVKEFEMSRQIYRNKAFDYLDTENLRILLHKEINKKNIESALSAAVAIVEYYTGEKF